MSQTSTFDRYHEQLDATRQERLAKWADIERNLPLAYDGRHELATWFKAREEFYSDYGPIPVSRADREVLADLKDRYIGERIFVLGNGPSLNDTPLHLLHDEFTFCVNRIYLLFDRIRWRPTFYTAVDWRVTADCATEINSLSGMHLFFPERFRGMLRGGDDVTWYWNGPSPDSAQSRFATDASLGIRGAGSVTGAAIQLAFHMGFDPIYLLGCDVSYTIPDTVIQKGPDRFGNGVGLYLTSTEDDDANHFDPRYFGAGRRWHDPNVKRMIEGFQQCREGADAAGRTILNATVGGNLEVFERVQVRSLFSRRRSSVPVRPRRNRQPQRQHLKVPKKKRVSAPLLIKSVLDEEPGLVLSIGAGVGPDLATFAANGWEIRAFEPHPGTHDELATTLPPQWPIFLDPRAIGEVNSSAHLYRHPSGGGSLVPVISELDTSTLVTVVTPDVALMPLNGRVPNLILLSAHGWEGEILRASSWDSSVDAVVVSVNDSFTQRLGFRGTDLARELERRGFDVFAVEHRRTGAFEAQQIVCRIEDSKGELTQVIGLRPGIASLDILEACRRAVLVAREEISAEKAIRARKPNGRQKPNSQQPSKLEKSDSDRAQAIALREELEAVHSSLSWKLGHFLVRTAKGVVTAPRRSLIALRRLGKKNESPTDWELDE